MFKRRDVLKLAAGSVAVATSAIGPAGALRVAQAQTPAPAAGDSPPPAPAAFDPASVVDFARALSKRPYRAPSPPRSPDPFASLNYDLYVGIKSKPESLIWGNDNVGFALEPLHRGFIFLRPDADQRRSRTASSANSSIRPIMFDFGRLAVPPDHRRHRLFGLPRPAAPAGRLHGCRHFPGRELLSRTRARPEFRRCRARPVDPHRRSARRGISGVPRRLDRKAHDRGQCAGDSRRARFGERLGRLSLHAAAGRCDDHRYGMHALRPHQCRSCRHSHDGGHACVRGAGSPPRRYSGQSFAKSADCRC